MSCGTIRPLGRKKSHCGKNKILVELISEPDDVHLVHEVSGRIALPLFTAFCIDKALRLAAFGIDFELDLR